MITLGQALQPRYLGDGVYVQVDAEDPTRIIVTTGGIMPDADNVVYLELSVMMGLKRFISNYVE